MELPLDIIPISGGLVIADDRQPGPAVSTGQFQDRQTGRQTAFLGLIPTFLIRCNKMSVLF
jgi:hypothetical protein